MQTPIFIKIKTPLSNQSIMAAATTTATVSQLSSFSSINGKQHQLQLRHRSINLRPLPPPSKLSVVMSVGGGGTNTSGTEIETTDGYTADDSKPFVEESAEPYSAADEPISEEKGSSDSLNVYGAAKIHDFCFGIPYGGLVLSGGLLGFIFSRNPTTLGTGVLFGGALLALSTFSLKIWRQGKSSLPFVLGQAVVSAILLWKNFQAYSLCWHAVILFARDDLWRKPTTKEVAHIRYRMIVMRIPEDRVIILEYLGYM